MLKPHVALEDIEHGLDDEALAQHDLVAQKHQMVAHIPPDAGDQVQAALPEWLLPSSGVVDRLMRRGRQPGPRAELFRAAVRYARTERSRDKAAACPARYHGAGAARTAAATRSLQSC